jgi:hypothetical protein
MALSAMPGWGASLAAGRCEGGGELLARGDCELLVGAGEVPIDSPGGGEQVLGDVAFGQTGGGELGDTALAGRQRVEPAEDGPPGSAAGGDEFGAGPLGQRQRPAAVGEVERGPQDLAASARWPARRRPPPGRSWRGRAPAARPSVRARVRPDAAARCRACRLLRARPRAALCRARAGRCRPGRARSPRPRSLWLRHVRRARVGRGRRRSATARPTGWRRASGRRGRRRRGGRRGLPSAGVQQAEAGRGPRAAILRAAWSGTVRRAGSACRPPPPPRTPPRSASVSVSTARAAAA